MATQPRYQAISLDKLRLDPHNPRLPKSLHGASEDAILEYMLLDASLIELMLAIGENDYFQGEQLLVVPDKGETFRVIEGNRRLSAVILLNHPERAKVQKSKIEKVLKETDKRPKEIPCLIFDEEANIHTYLGYRHITGIKEWRLLEKARYLYGLWKQNFSTYNVDDASKEIAKIIGSRRDYVRRILVGFEVYKVIEDEKFFRIKDLNDTTFYFNYIADSLNRQYIAEFLGVDFDEDEPAANLKKEHLEEWTTWLFKKNDQNRTRLIGDSYNLNSLNTILSHKEAKEAFRKRDLSLEAAKELTGEIDTQFQSFIKKSIEALDNADRLVTRVKLVYEDVNDDIKNIRALALKILRSIQDKQDEDEL